MAVDRDVENSVERVVSAARFVRNHQFSIIPNTSHGCHNDNFEATWASIEPFLKKQILILFELTVSILILGI
jgi:pimeloyl-ACP methyl ester carboxylesterase